MGSTLRLAEPADALEVARVHVRSWQIGYRGLLPQAYLDGLRPEERASRYTFGDRDPAKPETIVAMEDTRIAGFVTIGPGRGELADAGILMALYVDPERWGRGIGRALIERGRSRLVERGYDQAALSLLDGNERAERFYLADGWWADGHVEEEEMWGIRVVHHRYRRALP